jgi:hypothetical protein
VNAPISPQQLISSARIILAREAGCSEVGAAEKIGVNRTCRLVFSLRCFRTLGAGYIAGLISAPR